MVREIAPELTFGFLGGVGALLGVYLFFLHRRGGSDACARPRFRRHLLTLTVFYGALAVYLANGKRHLQVDTQPVSPDSGPSSGPWAGGGRTTPWPPWGSSP